MNNALKKIIILSLTCVMLLGSTLTVNAAPPELLDLAVRTNSAKIGTKDGYGYKYNTTLRWDYSSNSVNGYYLTVTKYNDTSERYYIRQTITTNPTTTSDDIYGLEPGKYFFALYAIDANYNLLKTHYYYVFYIDYNGGSREIYFDY